MREGAPGMADEEKKRADALALLAKMNDAKANLHADRPSSKAPRTNHPSSRCRARRAPRHCGRATPGNYSSAIRLS